MCFSAEEAATADLKAYSIESVEKPVGCTTSPQHSINLSFVLDSGIKLLKDGKADFLYLTLSDTIRDRCIFGNEQFDKILHDLDARIGRLIKLGAVVAVIRENGISDKPSPDGFLV